MASYSQWNNQRIVEQDDWVLSWKYIHASSLEKSRSRLMAQGTRHFADLGNQGSCFWVPHFFSQQGQLPKISSRRVANFIRPNSCDDLGLVISWHDTFFWWWHGGQSHLLPHHSSWFVSPAIGVARSSSHALIWGGKQFQTTLLWGLEMNGGFHKWYPEIIHF